MSAKPERDRHSAWDSWHRERKKKDRSGESLSANKVIPLNAAIQSWIEQGQFATRLREANLLTHWQDFVGETIASKSVPQRLERGRLVLKVSDSAWRHQLLYMKRELIGTINGKLGQPLVKEIVLT